MQATLTPFLLLVFALNGSATGHSTREDSGLSNTVVLIIRHAEKPIEGNQLSPEGVARSKAYVDYFHRLKIDGKPLRLDHLFATADSKNSCRERLTLQPLATDLHMSLDLRFKNKQVDQLAAELRSHPFGHEILICWHHGRIPALVEALGEKPNALIPGGKWPDKVFDWVVELRFDAKGTVDPKRCKLIHEHLMPGDGA